MHCGTAVSILHPTSTADVITKPPIDWTITQLEGIPPLKLVTTKLAARTRHPCGHWSVRVVGVLWIHVARAIGIHTHTHTYLLINDPAVNASAPITAPSPIAGNERFASPDTDLRNPVMSST